MPNIFDGFLKQVVRGDQIKDRQHAARLFVDNNFRLAPKSDWIFHVFFDLDQSLTRIKDSMKLVEHGMLVKSVDLPKFSIQSKTLNEYNRPNVVQTKISYNDINITFHDDQANVVRGLWYDYLTYYYRDLDIGYSSTSGAVNPAHYSPSLYNDSQRGLLNRFGYSPRSYDAQNEQQYIKAIRIYSLHQKRFSEYTLVNPTIAGFQHGTHNTGSGTGMECSMSIVYETVLYASGFVTKNTVRGFADLHYDKSPSPLTPAGGGTNSILGPGGILNAVDDIFRDGGDKKFGAAAFTALRAFNTNKDVNLTGLAKSELTTAVTDMIRGKDPRDRFFIPTAGSLTNQNFPGLQNSTGSLAMAPGIATSNGSSVNLGAIGGAAVPAAALAVGSLNGVFATTSAASPAGPFISPSTGQNLTNNLKGVSTGINNAVTGGSLNQIYNVNKQGDVTSSQAQPSFDFLASAVKQQQESLRSAVQSLPTNNTINLTGMRQGMNSAITGASALGTAFVTGSNQVLPGTSNNPLLQTPHKSTIISESATVASREVKNFINNTNLATLSELPSYYGTSTPPAPSSVSGGS
jgi:hypothetical protein